MTVTDLKICLDQACSNSVQSVDALSMGRPSKSNLA